ncbi:MAG: Serine/threonine-protein kinase RsbW [uncultured Thiotrichaceae bacterium]|uniref:Serine/threonine-protein kinase RsbW n=1 Tax=uncultured Thiotrichaceae bacterium TaxID=298394 RepID=A0A6S6S705_9GAMM|nr:MAG: Serine/threonine-protein kinase RsbW [uncultured Thiotrichaceae bacterium]
MSKDSKVYNIQLQIDSQMKHIRLLGGALRGIGAELELTNDQIGQLELILVEAVTNVIEHAYEYKTGNQIQVKVECDPDNTIKMIISDRGKSMPDSLQGKLKADRLSLPEPELLPESGWGMGLIQMLSDSFHYERNNEQNYWHIMKCLA